MAKKDELAGLKFNRLTVIGENGRDGTRVKWLCQCDCGKRVSVIGKRLKNGNTKSCGCLKLEVSTKHGMHGRPENAIWRVMKYRCVNPNAQGYQNYGGRGIRVCERWSSSFEAFMEDMGPRPSSSHSIERVDNNGDYEPSNCRWETRKSQQRNRRVCRPVIRSDGVRFSTMAEAAEILGVTQTSIRSVCVGKNKTARGYSFVYAPTH